MVLSELSGNIGGEEWLNIPVNQGHDNKQIIERKQVRLVFNWQNNIKQLHCEIITFHLGQFMHQLQLSQRIYRDMCPIKYALNHLHGNLLPRHLTLSLNNLAIATLTYLSFDLIIVLKKFPYLFFTLLLFLRHHLIVISINYTFSKYFYLEIWRNKYNSIICIDRCIIIFDKHLQTRLAIYILISTIYCH